MFDEEIGFAYIFKNESGRKQGAPKIRRITKSYIANTFLCVSASLRENIPINSFLLRVNPRNVSLRSTSREEKYNGRECARRLPRTLFSSSCLHWFVRFVWFVVNLNNSLIRDNSCYNTGEQYA